MLPTKDLLEAYATAVKVLTDNGGNRKGPLRVEIIVHEASGHAAESDLKFGVAQFEVNTDK